jgi:hypothetical protein
MERVDDTRLHALGDGRNRKPELQTLDENAMGSTVVVDGRVVEELEERLAMLDGNAMGLSIVERGSRVSEGSGP